MEVRPEHFAGLTTPSAPSLCSAPPPLRGGECCLAGVAGLRPNLHLVTRHFDANVMKPSAVGHVVAKVILPSEFGPDFLENGRNCILLRNVKSAATADLRKGFQRVRIDQHGGPDRHEVQ